MTDLTSTTYALGVAAARSREFAALYRLVLIVEAAFGLLLLIVPHLAARSFGLPNAMDDRLWGAMLIVTVLLQLPGLVAPIHARLTVIAGLAGRSLLALCYLLLHLWLPALVTAAATIALTLVFTKLIYAEIGSRP